MMFLPIMIATNPASAQVNILGNRYDNERTGANLEETQLTTANVNTASFGKLWSYTVSGSVYAQPLYVANLTMDGNPHNVLYVATMNNDVYAFDADANSDNVLWTVNLGPPIPMGQILPPDENGNNITGNVGIESTPVIDLSTNTLYLLARTWEDGSFFQRLHALDLLTGQEKFNGPVVVQGSVAGTGDGGDAITFDPKMQNQRAGLALANNQVFIAWASHEDVLPYHGWVMSYDAGDLHQTGIFCTTPDVFNVPPNHDTADKGGVWMSGRAPVVDTDGNVYYMVGNGAWDGNRNFGDSFLKFSSANGLQLVDWFTPDDWLGLGDGDEDLGSSGPFMIPGTGLLVGGGKENLFYLLQAASLGNEVPGNTQIPQVLNNQQDGSSSGSIFSGPALWSSRIDGPALYVWADQDVMKAYHFNGVTFDTAPFSSGTVPAPMGNSGGSLAISARAGTPGTAIVWALIPLSDDADVGLHQGILRAFDAEDLTHELWNSQIVPGDDSGIWAKYNPPTVVNGRVYVASFPSDGVGDGAILVYGRRAP
jgi:hypothetical protein